MQTRRRLHPAKRRSRSDPETHPRGDRAVSSRRRPQSRKGAKPSQAGDASARREPGRLETETFLIPQSWVRVSSTAAVRGESQADPPPPPLHFRRAAPEGSPHTVVRARLRPPGHPPRGDLRQSGGPPLDDVPGRLGSGAKLPSSSALRRSALTAPSDGLVAADASSIGFCPWHCISSPPRSRPRQHSALVQSPSAQVVCAHCM